jgi:hypothetical protein
VSWPPPTGMTGRATPRPRRSSSRPCWQAGRVRA